MHLVGLNSTFFPLNVIVHFIFIWHYRRTVSIHGIKLFIFITDRVCVYCAVRIGTLNAIPINFVFTVWHPFIHSFCLLSQYRSNIDPYILLPCKPTEQPYVGSHKLVVMTTHEEGTGKFASSLKFMMMMMMTTIMIMMMIMINFKIFREILLNLNFMTTRHVTVKRLGFYCNCQSFLQGS